MKRSIGSALAAAGTIGLVMYVGIFAALSLAWQLNGPYLLGLKKHDIPLPFQMVPVYAFGTNPLWALIIPALPFVGMLIGIMINIMVSANRNRNR